MAESRWSLGSGSPRSHTAGRALAATGPHPCPAGGATCHGREVERPCTWRCGGKVPQVLNIRSSLDQPGGFQRMGQVYMRRGAPKAPHGPGLLGKVRSTVWVNTRVNSCVTQGCLGQPCRSRRIPGGSPQRHLGRTLVLSVLHHAGEHPRGYVWSLMVIL